jgi:hypothetical protein
MPSCLDEIIEDLKQPDFSFCFNCQKVIRIHNIELFKKDKSNLLTDLDFPLIGLIPSDEEGQGVPDLVVVAEEPYLGLEYTLHIPPNLRYRQMEMPRF